MKKKNNNKLFILLIIIAAIIVIMVFFIMTAKDKVSVIAAVSDIPKGTVVRSDNVDSYFKNIKLSEKNIPEGAIMSFDELTDKETVTEIKKGDVILSADVAVVKDPSESMTNPVVIGLKAVESAQFVSGVIRKGDLINISVVNTLTGESESILDDVYVCGAYNSDGSKTEDDDCAMMINIIIEKEYEQLINEKIQSGTLRISKVGCDILE